MENSPKMVAGRYLLVLAVTLFNLHSTRGAAASLANESKNAALAKEIAAAKVRATGTGKTAAAERKLSLRSGAVNSTALGGAGGDVKNKKGLFSVLTKIFTKENAKRLGLGTLKAAGAGAGAFGTGKALNSVTGNGSPASPPAKSPGPAAPKPAPPRVNGGKGGFGGGSGGSKTGGGGRQPPGGNGLG